MSNLMTRTERYRTRIAHDRTERVARGFAYQHDLWLVDLDQPPCLPRLVRPWLRFDARDHVGDPHQSIRANVDAYLAEHGVENAGRVVMLANPRSLGHVFNPLSVFWCYSPSGALAAVIAEVHNTYGGRHCYLLRPNVDGRATVDKEFYVSPFFTVDGAYDMQFSEPGADVRISIDLRRGDQLEPVFRASVTGRRMSRSRTATIRAVLAQPFVSRRVKLLIRWQGVRLWLRRVPVIPRPDHGASVLHHEGV